VKLFQNLVPLINIEKYFDIKMFLQSSSQLSNNDSNKIKQYFIQYITFLVHSNIIENKFEILQNGIRYPIL